MAKGLSVPIGVDGTGGTLWVEGEPNDRKTIMTSLGDCESENAFQQDLGLGAEMVFANSTVDLRSSIMRRVKSIFLEFRRQHRYKLLNNTIQWLEGDEEGEMVLEFKYLNLESDEEQTFRESFRR